MPRYRYGLQWGDTTDDLQIEFCCIQRGGKWVEGGREVGMGLFHHYKEAQKLLWPKDYHHRWSDLELKEILNNTITVILGPKDTGKTHVALVRFGLTDYFAFPNNTLIVVSSTTIQALERRVWGDMKSMFQQAKERWPWLPGVCLESARAIATDDINDDETLVRDMRKGICCVACKNSAGQWQGMASYVGMKQERRRHLGDEFQFMSSAMMDSIANMNSGNYKGIFVGNPIGQNDPLDKMSEPVEGWESQPEITKTETWKNRRFLDSRTICLYGPDSPTYDFEDGTKRYPGLINEDSINRVIAGYGKDSHQYYSQCLGVRKSGLNARRVITRELCRQFNAFENVVWSGRPTTKIGCLDAAYGGTGGDRCMARCIEFGENVEGKTMLQIHPVQLVPVSVKRAESPEDQIAKWCKDYFESIGVLPENFFYDSTGRGTLGPAFARIWSVNINPVEFGGAATDRPVSMDIFIWDTKENKRRLKKCSEHYSKRVTEFWFSVRYAIEAGQVRGMTDELVDEGSAREWKEVSGNVGARIEIEGKRDMKERVGYSPDDFDCLVTGVEGARRRGFQISKLGTETDDYRDTSYLDDLRAKSQRLQSRNVLSYRK